MCLAPARDSRTLLWIFAFIVVSNVLLAQKAEQRADRDAAKYVGTEICQGCHEEAYQSFAKTAHQQTEKNKAIADRGCEACHGPGAQHVEMGGDPAKIWSYSDASARMIVDRCQRCHQSSTGQDHTQGKEHCLNCHSAHHSGQPKLLRADP